MTREDFKERLNGANRYEQGQISAYIFITIRRRNSPYACWQGEFFVYNVKLYNADYPLFRNIIQHQFRAFHKDNIAQ